MRLSGYRFGRVEVNGEEWDRDVAVLPGGTKPWVRKEGHRVHPDDLGDALAADPQLLVVGTGYFGRLQVSQEVEGLLAERGAELLALKTAEAVDAYNELSRKRRTCALLHLTC
ncbi:MAG: Mth938-like domain-containing protein [Candidatus Bipolaricaulaceae bacterium]